MNQTGQSPNDPKGVDGDEFFIGWEPTPKRDSRYLGPIVAAILAAVPGIAASVAYLQKDPGAGRWDSNEVQSFDGLAVVRPYPMILIPGAKPGDQPRTMLLVDEGKVGALPRVEQIVNGRSDAVAARATGTILHRDGRSMLELVQEEKGIRLLTANEKEKLPPLGRPKTELLEEYATLLGEIIDPKCYLGAMKPGGDKTHKACAMLCVSGGVPPMLVTRDAEKNETFYLLVTAEGGAANEQVLKYVGDRVEVSGRMERYGDLLVLRIATDGVHRR